MASDKDDRDGIIADLKARIEKLDLPKLKRLQGFMPIIEKGEPVAREVPFGKALID
jgi:hypothetical protein